MDPVPDKRCSECGRAVSDRSLPTVGWLSVRVLFPPLMVIAAITSLAIRIAQSRVVGPGSGGTRTAAVLLEPGFTYLQVKALADGESASTQPSLHAALTQYINEQPPRLLARGDCAIDVAFYSPRGDRESVLKFGWPTLWFIRTERRVFGDVMAESNWQPISTQKSSVSVGSDRRVPATPIEFAPSRPRWSTNGRINTVAFRPTVEETNGVEVWIDLKPFGMLTSLGLVAIGWYVIGLTLRVEKQARQRLSRTRCMIVRICGVAVLMVFLLGMCVALMTKSDRVPGRLAKPAQPPSVGSATGPGRETFPTSVRASGLAAREGIAATDRSLAAGFINAIKEPVGDDDYLGVRLVSELEAQTMEMAIYSRPVRLLTYLSWNSAQNPEFTDHRRTSLPAETRIRLLGETLQIESHPDDETSPVRNWQIHLDAFGAIAVALWFVWLVARAASRAPRRQIMRNRRRQGRCAGCGYQMTVPA